MMTRVKMTLRHWLPLVLFFWGNSLHAQDGQADRIWLENLRWEMDTLMQNGFLETTQLGLCIYDLTADSMIYAKGAKQRMRPASTEKLLTAITALHELGAGYLFNTYLYYTGEVHDRILHGNVYVVGGFDPCFDASDMNDFVNTIASLGIDSIAGQLCADLSMKDTLQWGWGWCWDDGMTRLTPLLYKEKDMFLQVMKDRLKQRNIGCSGTAEMPRPQDATLLLRKPRPLRDILHPMMKDSENLYAEALFYQLAAKTGKPYASRKDAVYYIEKMVRMLGYDPRHFIFADGSGLSLYNYLSPELEIAFLRYAYRTDSIFSSLYQSLPVAGVDGTLENRMKETVASDNVRAKTGTLEGVFSLSGYALAPNTHMLAFCIINQGVERGKHARAFQDSVCKILCK